MKPLVLLFSIILCFTYPIETSGQNTTDTSSYFQWKDKRWGDYKLPYGVMGIYLVDTIKIEHPIILHTLKDNHEFLMTESFYKKNKKKFTSSKIASFLLDEADDFFIYDNYGDILFMPSFMHHLLYEENRPDFNYYIELYSKNKYKLYEMIVEPDYYLVLLVRGDAYTNAISHVWDIYYGNIKFKEPKAYYKWLIPVWRK